MEELSTMLPNTFLDNVTAIFSMIDEASSTIGHVNESTSGNFTRALTPDQNLSGAFYLGLRALWSLLAIVGNALTIFVVVNFEALHTNNNILVCSLAAADILGGILGPFFIYHQTNLNSRFYVPICLLEKTMNLISAGVNLHTILFISIDRYIYIKYPLRYYAIMTRSKIWLLIGITWGFFCFPIPLAMYFGSSLEIGTACKFGKILHPIIYKFYVLPNYFVVMWSTVGVYVAIAKIAHTQGRAIAALNQPYDTIEASMNRKSWKMVKTLGTLLGLYILCIMPQYIFMITAPLFKKELDSNQSRVGWTNTTGLLYWANIWINPLIYVWKIKEFRVAFKRLFLGIRATNEVNVII